jgi:histidinol-phosphate phosphatase family protein
MTATRAAVFLDKDGTLVENVPFNVDPARLAFTPRALPALKRLAEAGYALVVVTNQPGIATGRIGRAEFARLECALAHRVRVDAGVELAGIFACPHAPGAAGEPACPCRKPAAGLLERAARSLGIDLARSWMVGDILDDIEAGARAGCRTVLLDVGNETVWRTSPLRTPRHRVRDLYEAAQCIVAEDFPRDPSTASGRGGESVATEPA